MHYLFIPFVPLKLLYITSTPYHIDVATSIQPRFIFEDVYQLLIDVLLFQKLRWLANCAHLISREHSHYGISMSPIPMCLCPQTSLPPMRRSRSRIHLSIHEVLPSVKLRKRLTSQSQIFKSIFPSLLSLFRGTLSLSILLHSCTDLF